MSCARRCGLSLPRIVGLVLFICASTHAQDRRIAQPPRAENAERNAAEARPQDRPRIGQGQLHRDFGFPAATRPWERSFYLNPRRPASYGRVPLFGYGRWHDYSPYHSFYHHDRYRDFDNRLYRGPAYEDYSLRLDHAYDLGVAPREIQDAIAIQAERSLSEYRDVMEAGHAAFSRGAYSAAARFFLLAADLNHGDPSSRLCAAHAQTALGRYQEAAALVHRAIDLQSKLVFIPIDISGSYRRPGDFEDHVDGLRAAAEERDEASLWFLLGYYYHNSDQPKAAAEALQRARTLDPNDRVVGRLADAACGISP